MAEDRVVIVQVKRSRDFGAGGIIEVSLSDFHVHPDHQKVVFMRLAADCDSLLDMYIENTPALNIYGKGGGLLPGQILPTDITTEKHPATGISVTMKDGKKYYKVKGGKYSEHGINFWPEHMKKCGFSPESVPEDGYTFKGETMMVVEYEKGQPKRVIALEKV